MADIKYSYAYDGDVVVHIDDVSEHGTFYCISCGKEMVAKLGDKKSHHFAHKVNDVSCNSETYLHKLAKLLLKKKFQEGGFEIEISQYSLCKESENCLFENNCKVLVDKKYDLRRYYDTCEEEQYVDGFCADLLITGEGQPSILVEIYVSHECSNQKINSGHRIIEIPINSETDIEYFCKNVIAERAGVHFYGFKKNLNKREERMGDKVIFRFIFYENGNTVVRKYFCQNQYKKDTESSLFELNIDEYMNNNEESYDSEHDYFHRALEKRLAPFNIGRISKIGLVYAVRKGLLFKNCHLCKYARDDNFGEGIFCNMSKNGTPPYPKQQTASYCMYYSFDEKIIREVTSLFSDIKISEVK